MPVNNDGSFKTDAMTKNSITKQTYLVTDYMCVYCLYCVMFLQSMYGLEVGEYVNINLSSTSSYRNENVYSIPAFFSLFLSIFSTTKTQDTIRFV